MTAKLEHDAYICCSLWIDSAEPWGGPLPERFDLNRHGGKMKKGFRFLHVSWLNSSFSIAETKTLPRATTAQEFVVTKVQRGCVYYRPVYRHGGVVTNLGSAFIESIDKFPSRVLCEAGEDGLPIGSGDRA